MPYADRWHGFSTSCCRRCKESAAAERAPVHEVLEVGADVGVVVLHIASRGLYGSGLDRHLLGQLLCIPQPILRSQRAAISLSMKVSALCSRCCAYYMLYWRVCHLRLPGCCAHSASARP